MGRSRDREAFDERVRVTLLEDDMDKVDLVVTRMETSIRRLIMAVLAAALSLTTASLLLAFNLVAGA